MDGASPYDDRDEKLRRFREMYYSGGEVEIEEESTSTTVLPAPRFDSDETGPLSTGLEPGRQSPEKHWSTSNWVSRVERLDIGDTSCS